MHRAFHLYTGHLLIPLFVALGAVLLELVWRVAVASKGYDFRGALSTLAIAVGHRALNGLGALIISPLFALAWRVAPWHWPLHDWRTWVVGFFVVELAYYWDHRFSHEVRWLWANHSVHHTAEQITFLSAVRLGWAHLFSPAWMVYLPVALFGFDPRLIFLLLAIDLRFQFFLHTEAKITLGPLEWVLNTPAHHRVHHASNGPYLDKNYGGALIIYDRLFGTFAKEIPAEPLRYGLAHPVGSNNPLVLALGEWRRLFVDMYRAPGLLAAARIALGRPT